MACLHRPVASDVCARACFGDSRTRDSPDAVGFFIPPTIIAQNLHLTGGGGNFVQYPYLFISKKVA